MADPDALSKLAEASVLEGVAMLRVEGLEAIPAVRARCRTPIIGLIKARYEGSEVQITPSGREVEALIAAGCEIIALDATARPRPGEPLPELIKLIHRSGRLAMADCDTRETVERALSSGADMVGSTLSGYTPQSRAAPAPDLELVRWACAKPGVFVLGEGRYEEPWHAQAALRIGAKGVVVGGALNDPVKQTRRFLAACRSRSGNVGAVDLGGTWIRFGLFDQDWRLLQLEREPRPESAEERLSWIRSKVAATGVESVGVGSGGVVSPRTGAVVRAKGIIPDHVGCAFDESTIGVETRALNDGLATAWGHACHPRFAGRRTATLAIGTGLGFGLVERGHILMGPLGQPPNLADVPYRDSTLEAALCGGPSDGTRRNVEQAFRFAVEVVQNLFQPEDIVVCGSVGLGQELAPTVHELEIETSPFGEHAGLYGAAALALFPPPGL